MRGRESLVKLLCPHPKMLDCLPEIVEVSFGGWGSGGGVDLSGIGVLRHNEQGQQVSSWVRAVDCSLSERFEERARSFMCRHDRLHDRPEQVDRMLGFEIDVLEG